MNNYQVLEIVLDAAFFATVAAIAVIFALIRERSLRKAQADQVAERSSRFPEMLDRAAGCIHEFPGAFEERREPEDIIRRRAAVEPVRMARQHNTRKELSRAERELIANIAAGRS